MNGQLTRLTLRAALLLGVFVLAAVVGAGTGSAAPHQAGGTPLRSINWTAALTADPVVTVLAPSECLPPPAAVRIICVDVPQSPQQFINPSGAIADQQDIVGYIAPGDILYGDLDGDGVEEAVLTIQSGGTAGAFGFLVYQQASPAPRLISAQSGYKVGDSISDGVLSVSAPLYFGFEPNCCPTALFRYTFVVANGALTPYAQPGLFLFSQDGERPALPAVATVVAYYRALDSKEFDFAYSLLTSAAQNRLPFNAWKAGYAATQSISVVATTGDSPVTVNVSITATDVSPGGVSITQQFVGTWNLTRLDAAPLGLGLDTAAIRVAP